MIKHIEEEKAKLPYEEEVSEIVKGEDSLTETINILRMAINSIKELKDTRDDLIQMTNAILQIDEPEAIIEILKENFLHIQVAVSETTPSIRALRELDSQEFTALKQGIFHFDESWDETLRIIPNAKDLTEKYIQSQILDYERKFISRNLVGILSINLARLDFFYNIIIALDETQKVSIDRPLKNTENMTPSQIKKQKIQILNQAFEQISSDKLNMSVIESLAGTNEVDAQTLNQIKKYLDLWVENKKQKEIVGEISENKKNYESLLTQISEIPLSSIQKEEIALKQRFLKLQGTRQEMKYQSELFTQSEIKLLKQCEAKYHASHEEQAQVQVQISDEEKKSVAIFDITDKELINYSGVITILKQKLVNLTTIKSNTFFNSNSKTSPKELEIWDHEKHQYQWRANLHQMHFYKKIINFINQHCPALNFLIIENHIRKVNSLIEQLDLKKPQNNSSSKPFM